MGNRAIPTLKFPLACEVNLQSLRLKCFVVLEENTFTTMKLKSL